MNKGFTKHANGRLIYYTIPDFDKAGMVKHCFTTRHGGVTADPDIGSMNLGFHRGDDRENVLENYRIICDEIGTDCTRAVLSNQVHDDKIHFVKEEDAGKGIYKESDIKGIDALMTDVPGIPLVTFYADCVPLYFLDVKHKAIALAHSGWKGTQKRIAVKTIESMKDAFGTVPGELLVGIGPSIGVCHFEVGKEVYDCFEGYSGVAKISGGKYYVDLWHVIIAQLMQCGVSDGNITLADMCTYCMNDEFFSHRVQGNNRGNMAAILCLKED